MRRLRSRVTYANVVATIALFLALGGVSYAATQLPKNSVGTKQLRKNAVNSSKVKNGSLTLGDFKKSQRSKLRGPKGATGAKGDAGATGAPGAAGAPGVSGWQIVSASATASEEFAEEEVLCPAGKRILGGGALIEGEGAEEALSAVALDGSGPREGGTGWLAGAHEHAAPGEGWTLRVWAICANVS